MNPIKYMKRSILIILLSILFANLKAQVSEGKIMFGTSISYTDQVNDNYDAQGNLNGVQVTNNNLGISLQGGYFFTDDFVVGLTVNYVDNKAVNQNLPVFQNTSISKTWYYGVFGRTYTRITEKLYFINSFSISIQSGTNNDVTDSMKTSYSANSSLKVNGYQFSFAPGLSYFLNSWIALNANVGGVSYNHITATITSGNFNGTSTTNGLFSLNLPLSNFNFGVNFLIGKGINNSKLP